MRSTSHIWKGYTCVLWGGLCTCFTGCILRIYNTWTKANILCFHGPVCSSWFKIDKSRKKQHKASDPAVGDDGIRDDLNKNPAVPQCGTDGCHKWSVALLIVWVAKAIGWLFWSELSLHKGAPFISWNLAFSSQAHFSQLKTNATQWVLSKI